MTLLTNAINGVYVSFNQDSSSLTVCNNKSYKILALNSIDTLNEICETPTDGMCIVERLFSSSLIAMVSIISPRKLRVCHFKKGSEICNYSYASSILSVRLNRNRLVVCLAEAIYIHNIKDMSVIHNISETPPNPNGVMALCTNSDNSLLAYPLSSSHGKVMIFDTTLLVSKDKPEIKTQIDAHNSPVVAMEFDPTGLMLATASEKGTVIRVFNTKDGSPVHLFRRGVKRCVNISKLAFSPDSLLLAATSNTETVHIFKIGEDTLLKIRQEIAPPEEPTEGWLNFISKVVSASSNYLPPVHMLTLERAYSTAILPKSGLNICTLAVIQNSLRLLVASSEGILYIYNVEPECKLIKEHQLVPVHVPSENDDMDEMSPSPPNNATEYEVDTKGTGSVSSYAGILKGFPQGNMTEFEKLAHLLEASKMNPEDDPFKMNDKLEFPPINHNSNDEHHD